MSAIIQNNKIFLTNPVSKEEIGQLDICNEPAFLTIVKNATTYDGWTKLDLKQRCHCINKFRKKILNNKI